MWPWISKIISAIVYIIAFRAILDAFARTDLSRVWILPRLFPPKRTNQVCPYCGKEVEKAWWKKGGTPYKPCDCEPQPEVPETYQCVQGTEGDLLLKCPACREPFPVEQRGMHTARHARAGKIDKEGFRLRRPEQRISFCGLVYRPLLSILIPQYVTLLDGQMVESGMPVDGGQWAELLFEVYLRLYDYRAYLHGELAKVTEETQELSSLRFTIEYVGMLLSEMYQGLSPERRKRFPPNLEDALRLRKEESDSDVGEMRG